MKKKTLYRFGDIILLTLVFFISIFLAKYYTLGDQYYYHLLYDGVKDKNLSEAWIFYKGHINSKEFIHFLLIWIFSNINVDKDIFIAMSNIVLAFGALKIMRKLNASTIIIAIILLTNFYFYVLYIPAERLKYGFIFLFLSIAYIRYIYLFGILSVLGHAQNIIFYSSIIFAKLSVSITKNIKKLFLYGKLQKTFINQIVIIFILGLIIYFSLHEHLNRKFEGNLSQTHSIIDIFKIFIFYFLAIYYSKERIFTTLLFIPLIIFTFLLGGQRIVFLGYFVFLYYALQVKRGLNLGILLTSIYFFYQTIEFINKTILYHNGFYHN